MVSARHSPASCVLALLLFVAPGGAIAAGATPAKKATPLTQQTGGPLLALTPGCAAQMQRARDAHLIEVAPVHLPAAEGDDCNHYGWPIATMIHDTIVVMHRRIPGHRAAGAGRPTASMSYGVVVRSEDGGGTWSEPYDLRACMRPEDRERGGLVPLSHRGKFDPQNRSREGYKVHMHALGTMRNGVVVAINNHGVFRSDDAGRTWRHHSTALRDDHFPHDIVSLGPRVIDGGEEGWLAFGNWSRTASSRFVVLRARDLGNTWQVEDHPAGFPQYEPAVILHAGQYWGVTRDQGTARSHRQLSWQPGQVPWLVETNLQDPKHVDTVDLCFNPVTERFEVVRSERYRMELWLWSLDPREWTTGQWRRECRLLAREGKFYQTADGFHPAGAVIDQKRGVQHVFIHSGHPNGPAGVFRLTRSLDTAKLVAALGANAGVGSSSLP